MRNLIALISCKVSGSFLLLLFFFLAQQPPVSQGLLIHEVSRSHTTTRHIR